ncbi:uncharacterized protein JCM6883_000611 [Sporobolomyces salmoneus]|uniref:uncharacterized protein n=1 Tax=Sporobolomyces salmoneus TaxID=183962 RepID=UPI0031730D71
MASSGSVPPLRPTYRHLVKKQDEDTGKSPSRTELEQQLATTQATLASTRKTLESTQQDLESTRKNLASNVSLLEQAQKVMSDQNSRIFELGKRIGEIEEEKIRIENSEEDRRYHLEIDLYRTTKDLEKAEKELFEIRTRAEYLKSSCTEFFDACGVEDAQ